MHFQKELTDFFGSEMRKIKSVIAVCMSQHTVEPL